jgi:PKD repeat protein
MRIYITTIATILLLLISSGLFSQVLVPAPYLPRQNVIVQNTVTLRWNTVLTATTYDVEYANNAAFAASTTVSAIAQPSLTLPTLTGGRYYYWRVRANTPGGTSAWSATWNFGLFSPPDFPDLVFWISADGPVNIDLANRVTQWTDRSGQGNHVTQSNPAKQPLLVSSGFNGRPVVRFDGGDVLSGGNVLNINSNSRTAVVFGKSNTNTGTYYAKAIAGAQGNRYALAYSSPKLLFIHHDATYKEVAPNRGGGATELIMTVADRSSLVLNLRVNGFNLGTPGTGIQGPTYNFSSTFRFLIGGYNDASDVNEVLPLNGDIAEMFFYDRAFTDSVRQIQEKYVMDKYYPPVTLGADTTFIYGFCGTTLNAGTGYSTYSWSGGGNTATKTITAPGTYSVTVTDIFGRASADTIIVKMPDPNFTGNTSICLGGNVTWNTGLSSSNYTFNWSPAANTSSIIISTPGTYRVTVTDTSGCSIVSSAVTFSIDSFKNKVAILAGPDTSLCSGNSLGLTTGASLVSAYLWSTSATTPTITLDTSGTYQVTVTNTNSCTASLTASVNITGSGPISNFSFDTICQGAATQFTDLSAIPLPYTVSNWQWSFGDASTSSLQNPAHTYSAAGTYNVTLISTSDSGCVSSPITKQILVRPAISARFNDTLACVNAPALFFDASTATSPDQIVSWNWNFGNTATSNLSAPQTTYSTLGTYPVSLTVGSQLGCSATITKNLTVSNTAPLPGSFDFTAPQPDGLNITTPTILFQWQTSANAVRYRLQVSTNSNFSNPIVNTVVTQTSYSTAVIPYSQNTYYYKVSAFNVCNDSVTSNVMQFYRFTPSVLPSVMQLWVMADGQLVKDGQNFVSSWIDQTGNGNNLNQTGSGQQPLWVDSIALIKNKPAFRFDGSDFLNGGDILALGNSSWHFFVVGRMNANDNTYFAKSLLANSPNRFGLLRTANQLNYLVHDIAPIQATSQTVFGKYELVHTNLNRLSGILELYRNSTLLSQSGGLISSYNNTSTSRFLLGAYNGNPDNTQSLYLDGNIAEIIGIDSTLTQAQVRLIERYLYHKYSGPVWLGPDIKIDYGFCDTVMLDASDRYVKYLWSTGDSSRTLRINKTGTYWVQVTDVFDQIYRDTVNVTLPSVALPTVSSICLGDSIIWNANLGPNYQYDWNVGDTTSTLVITAPGIYFISISDTNNPQCTYLSDLHIVTLDSFAITTTLGSDTTLCSGATIGLQSCTQNIIAYNWSDNSNSSTILVNNPGTYWVNVLNITGCQASDTIEVTIAGVLANVNFTVPNAFCLGDTSYFTNTSTIQSPYNITGYQWTFGQNADTSTLQNPIYFFDSAATYTVNLEVTADSGCVSSMDKTVQVFNKPTTKFSYQIGCAGAPINFSDQSVGVANDALAQWLWTFGDDSTSTLRSPSHTYAQAGIYAVSLSVTSTTGCRSVFTDTVEIFPELILDIDADNLCFGETTQFTDASPAFSNITWLWDFGDNTGISTQKNPTHNYTQTGSFLVSLSVKNALGCEATKYDTISIVQSPTANFTYNVACESFNFRLNDASTIAGNDPITKWFWEFNDGGLPSNAPNPVRTYDTVGTFNVTLSIESANGCPATVTKPVTIAPAPTASFTFTPDYGAAPLPVNYTNTSVGALSYQWYFSDGGYTTDQDPIHTFTYNSDFSTTLVAIGPGGCRDTFSNSLTVNISTLDIAVVEINTQNVNGRIRPFATIINQGTRNVDHYFLTATLGDGSRITERVDSFLASGTGMIYYFVAGYEATEYQASSYLCVQASQPNDEVDDNALNDRLCKPLENDIRIVPPYPNPTNSSVTFEILMPREATLKVEMFDVLGHELMTIYDALSPKGTQTFKLDMSGYPRGVYILKVRFNDTNDYIFKFVAE